MRNIEAKKQLETYRKFFADAPKLKGYADISLQLVIEVTRKGGNREALGVVSEAPLFFTNHAGLARCMRYLMACDWFHAIGSGSTPATPHDEKMEKIVSDNTYGANDMLVDSRILMQNSTWFSVNYDICVCEHGLFSSYVDGFMLARHTFPEIKLGPGDLLECTVKATMTKLHARQ